MGTDQGRGTGDAPRGDAKAGGLARLLDWLKGLFKR